MRSIANDVSAPRTQFRKEPPAAPRPDLSGLAGGPGNAGINPASVLERPRRAPDLSGLAGGPGNAGINPASVLERPQRAPDLSGLAGGPGNGGITPPFVLEQQHQMLDAWQAHARPIVLQGGGSPVTNGRVLELLQHRAPFASVLNDVLNVELRYLDGRLYYNDTGRTNFVDAGEVPSMAAAP